MLAHTRTEHSNAASGGKGRQDFVFSVGKFVLKPGKVLLLRQHVFESATPALKRTSRLSI